MKETTGRRIRLIMNERNLKQIDILRLCEPYCEKYNIKLAKNDLSQYLNDKVQPGQNKLSILSMALGVSEVWLMGYDVPRCKEDMVTPTPAAPSGYEAQLLESFRQLNSEGQQKAIAYVSDLVDLPKYKKVSDSKAMA